MDIKNPVKAIRAKCLDCCCNIKKDVELCTCEKCSLYPFRFGEDPYKKKREYTEERRKAMRETAIKNLSRAKNTSNELDVCEETD